MCVGTEPGKPLWPESNLCIGDILIPAYHRGEKAVYYWKQFGGEQEGLLEVFNPDDFPHLFRPMPWYEGRKPEDMPLYLKSISSERVLEVKEYRLENGVFLSHIGTDPYESLNYFEPATEQEYLEYQKQKEG